jgi:hypothetical protein
MTDLAVRICIAGDALVTRWRRALWERSRLLAAYRVGRIGGRLFAQRPYLCTCRVCRAEGITHPLALRAARFVDLHKRPGTPRPADRAVPAPAAGPARPSLAEVQAALETFGAREVTPGVWAGSTRAGRPVVIRGEVTR